MFTQSNEVLFIKLTQLENEKDALICVKKIKVVLEDNIGSTVYFDNGEYTEVKQSVNDIMALLRG